ncbi:MULTISPECIES: DUF2637 domain-containing protein [unclassified Streptomyces]|uniref:DUF2637 domain-containing protein n=1 Tax=unclassified Streptomyces TaxID=2593676 RepID=UPI0006F3D50F|nr:MULTISPECIES: DUF2637 domain-containing protein [unclassified Streptomyces]KQX57976.1 SpdA protein [Streptomyces sp. Root1304]KRA95440.1 SpdA protein [Streptomyces sp. Root66D1]
MTSKLRVDAVLIQALIAGALSFAHLHDLAAAAGQTGWKAWAYPVSVDLLLVAAWRRLRSDGSSRLAWCWFLVSLFASLGANVATAGFLDLADPPAWLRFGIAGWPAVAFLGGTLLAHSSAPPVETETGPVPEPLVEPEPVSLMPTPPEYVAESEPVPPEPAIAPAAPVPAALVDHARKVAADHLTRTGRPIDTDALRARLGVPAPMADAIAAQLA